ncbi:MAG: (Fe-S)-binding protein [Acidimicrobiia bacterium]|nr:(Fe-S)-binding protein [Acidimicrobiia bacterium]
MEPRRRPTATLVLLVMAFAAFPATLLLWWMGTLPGHNVPEIGREIFGNVPGALQAAFYVGVGAFLSLTLYLFSERSRSWERGGAESRAGRWGERFRTMMAGLEMRTLLRDRAAGIMHALIYYGFVLLFLGTVTLEIDHLLPDGLKFLSGTFYKVYSAILDAAAIALVVGVVWAVIRRYGQAPWRLRSKTKAEDAWILTVLGLIGVTGIFTEAARIAVDGRPDFEVWSFVGYPLSSLFPASAAAGWHQFFWIFHVITFVWFLVILPTTKLRHMVTSPANMFLAPKDRPKGAMKALPNLMEATDIESLGASVITDLTWKQIFDTDACTVCGRCTSVCPANMTGKPLDPREMVLKVGEVAASTAPARISTPVSMDAEITIDAGSLFDRVTPEELWSCTTCRACDAICPVNIEILDKILDMRRYKALMEADFPTELGKAFVALENQGNPWGLSQQNRMDWAKDLDFKVKVLGDDGVESADYLYWVGCAGSFDDRNVEVTKATARLLHEAGIDFAILGPKESCTGDPARRSGNEYLYQQLALSNIETLNDLGVERVITQCPHCFNSLANDYPQLGGDYEVVHHSQLLMELVGKGSLDTAAATGTTPQITFHDPCYLGRHNDVYLAPREVVSASGASLVEMERNGTNAMCCGAGGARFWMEEQTGKKVNVERAEQAIATGADEVAVGCPYCYVMIDDGVKELGSEMRVRDISMILADSVFKK